MVTSTVNGTYKGHSSTCFSYSLLLVLISLHLTPLKFNIAFLSNVTTEQLLKLFFFPDWLKYQVRAGNFTNAEEAIREEVKTYADKELTRSDDFKSPKFVPILLPAPYTLWELSKDLTRHSVTDIGICETVNGHSMKATYKVMIFDK